MKKKVLTFIILFVLCRVNTGLCQEYLTLEQLKQQTPPRWVETYQDRYGRSTEVDIDIQIHGNTDAAIYKLKLATVYKGNIIKNLIMDCQSYTKYRPNETTGGIFVSWRRKEELPTGA